MKKTTILFFLILINISLFGQTQNKKDEKIIKNLIINSFDDLFSNLSTKNIEKYFTKDFILLENGEVWNNDTLTVHFEKARLKKVIPKRENNFEFIDIKIVCNMAWVAYHNYATLSIEDDVIKKIHWLESATAIMTTDGWKIQMMHSTRLKDK